MIIIIMRMRMKMKIMMMMMTKYKTERAMQCTVSVIVSKAIILQNCV